MNTDRKPCARSDCDNWFTPHDKDDNKKYCSHYCQRLCVNRTHRKHRRKAKKQQRREVIERITPGEA